jgi:hypothetical protein
LIDSWRAGHPYLRRPQDYWHEPPANFKAVLVARMEGFRALACGDPQSGAALGQASRLEIFSPDFASWHPGYKMDETSLPRCSSCENRQNLMAITDFGPVLCPGCV